VNTNDLPVIELRGSAKEKGRIHGEALKPKIHELLARWRDGLEARYTDLDYTVYREKFWEFAGTYEPLSRLTPYLLEEVEGISESAGVDLDELLIFQHANEQIWVAELIAASGGIVPERCSTIASLGQNGALTIVGHNLDWTRDSDGYQVLFRADAERDGVELLLSSCAGQISMNGLNSLGVAVGDNALPQLRPQKGGLPVFAIYRGILECRNFGEAREFLHRVPHASGLNWVLGDPKNVGMFEASSGKIVAYEPGGKSERLFHTNHPLVNDDYDPIRMGIISRRAQAPDTPFPRSSYLRWASLQMRLWDTRNPVTVEQVKAAFAACDDPEYPVCCGADSNPSDPQIGFSLVSCIWELEEGNPRVHIASGPAKDAPFRTFAFV
jgi:isopenicillin-N N-acyltransferase-like protein